MNFPHGFIILAALLALPCSSMLSLAAQSPGASPETRQYIASPRLISELNSLVAKHEKRVLESEMRSDAGSKGSRGRTRRERHGRLRGEVAKDGGEIKGEGGTKLVVEEEEKEGRKPKKEVANRIS
jgi:hypothetical protein